MSIYTIGIDPGKSGGIVALNNGHIISLLSMPDSPEKIADHFRYLGFPQVLKHDECHIFIENVHSMPTDGVRSAFVFGQGLGQLEGVIAAMGLPRPSKVNPATWLNYFTLTRDKAAEESKYDFKKRIRTQAHKLSEKQFHNKLTLKTCDAYLIALYGYKSLLAGAKSS